MSRFAGVKRMRSQSPSKATKNRVSLKCRLYRSLYCHGVAVFSDDITNPTALELCGCQFPAKGIELLRLLVELAREGKVVIWQDEYRHHFFLGFLPVKIWDRELADTSPTLRKECEAMKLNIPDSLWGFTLGVALAAVLPAPKSGYKSLKHREEELDEPPDHHYGKGNHTPADY